MTTLLEPGGKLDTAATLTPVRIAVLTISDTRDEESDTSGHILVERLTGAGHQLAEKDIVRDDVGEIRAKVKAWTRSGEIDVILTTGGTGITGRDVTPEAIEPLLDQPAFMERAPPADAGAIHAHWMAAWTAAVPGSDPARAAQLLAPVAAARRAAIYQGFLDRIEPSEHPYHAGDPADQLGRAARLVRAE